MTLLHISDTHGRHWQLPPLPEADVLVHSGDFTGRGTKVEFRDFLTWLTIQPHLHKIFIAGNHDLCVYGGRDIAGLPSNIHFLYNSGVEIDGVYFYGIPFFLRDRVDGSQDIFYQNIPTDADVLITHEAPFGVCDIGNSGVEVGHHGDPALRRRVDELNVQCHLFGHEHSSFGVEHVNGTVFSNGAYSHYISKPAYAQPKLFVYEVNARR